MILDLYAAFLFLSTLHQTLLWTTQQKLLSLTLPTFNFKVIGFFYGIVIVKFNNFLIIKQTFLFPFGPNELKGYRTK